MFGQEHLKDLKMKKDIFPFVVIFVSLFAIILVLTEPSQGDADSPGGEYYSLAQEYFHTSNEGAKVDCETKEVRYIDEDQRNIAYDIGYKKGYNNFMKTSVDPEAKEFVVEYTSNKEEKSKIDLDSEEIQEIIMKGYVDGYHKAGEFLHCPRKDY